MRYSFKSKALIRNILKLLKCFSSKFYLILITFISYKLLNLLFWICTDVWCGGYVHTEGVWSGTGGYLFILRTLPSTILPQLQPSVHVLYSMMHLYKLPPVQVTQTCELINFSKYSMSMAIKCQVFITSLKQSLSIDFTHKHVVNIKVIACSFVLKMKNVCRMNW